MSRTFRRKGFESTENKSHNKMYNSINGFYTKKKLIRVGISVYVYDCSVPSKKELGKMKAKVHCESKTSSSRSPNKLHRKNRMQENRTHNSNELRKYLTFDYDPVFIDKPISCLWDWD